MRDDVAFQSQVFGEQVAQRRDRYSQQKIDAYRSLPNVVNQFQQSQAQAAQLQMARESHQADMAQTASRLALDELRRKTAMEELAWANQLHQSDMLELQKQDMQTAVELRRAQAEKIINEQYGERERDLARMDPDKLDYMIGTLDMVQTLENGKIVYKRASEQMPPEMIAGARSRTEDRAKRGRGSPYQDINQMIRYWQLLQRDIEEGNVPPDQAEKAQQYADYLEQQLRAAGVNLNQPDQPGPKETTDKPVTMDEFRSAMEEAARLLRGR